MTMCYTHVAETYPLYVGTIYMYVFLVVSSRSKVIGRGRSNPASTLLLDEAWNRIKCDETYERKVKQTFLFFYFA